ncbi:MAG: helix-turn-helix transcriptional regulator [Bacteroidales bacterium]|jgi:regulator of cell morphogenesis and NO signaling|nr:helix-turn-helix transcriptional regulator [Bacteroidales bacterium]
MKALKMYEAGDKMISLIRDNYNILQSLNSFGISLGFGDKTVDETCRANKVDTSTFLAVVNFTINGTNEYDLSKLSASTLLHYLAAGHRYYLDYQLPFVRRELADAINDNFDFDDSGRNNDNVGELILQLYDQYSREIHKHMNYEEKTLFPYIEKLLQGEASTTYNIDTFAKHHTEADKSLKELKSLIIKYLPTDAANSNRLTSALYFIYNNEDWLANHQEVEDKIFVPLIRKIENDLKSARISNAISVFANADPETSNETISDREKEVIVAVVQGMSNKEIADHLCISVNTAITHRKNIARKLQIHSPAGLTIYAIVNGLVDIDALKK